MSVMSNLDIARAVSRRTGELWEEIPTPAFDAGDENRIVRFSGAAAQAAYQAAIDAAMAARMAAVEAAFAANAAVMAAIEAA